MVKGYKHKKPRTYKPVGNRNPSAKGEITLINSLIREYRAGAVKSKRSFNLTLDEFQKLNKDNCHYCGVEPLQEKRNPPCKRARHYSNENLVYLYNGIDRVNNTKGYEISNCVSACEKCNKMKAQMLQSEFFKWVERIHNFQNGIILADIFDLSSLIFKAKTTYERIMPENDKRIKAPGESISNYLFSGYSRRAKEKNLDFELNKEEFVSLISKNCHFCGTRPNSELIILKISPWGILYNGVDRLDNTLGYSIDNCVPACKDCNHAKSIYTKDFFLEHIEKIYNNLINRKDLQ